MPDKNQKIILILNAGIPSRQSSKIQFKLSSIKSPSRHFVTAAGPWLRICTRTGFFISPTRIRFGLSLLFELELPEFRVLLRELSACWAFS
jgi:hypothetical protein